MLRLSICGKRMHMGHPLLPAPHHQLHDHATLHRRKGEGGFGDPSRWKVVRQFKFSIWTLCRHCVKWLNYSPILGGKISEGVMSETEAEGADELTNAIHMAKAYLLKAFKGERIENLGLEEVQHDEYQYSWDITLGFNRPRDISQTMPSNFLQFAAAASAARPPRIYKVVRVDMQKGEAVSIKNRKDD